MQLLAAERVESLAYDKELRKQDLVEPEALLSVLIRLEGIGANDFACSWEGEVKWQGESHYRPKHKRLNWFVGVVIVSVPSVQDIDINVLSRKLILTR